MTRPDLNRQEPITCDAYALHDRVEKRGFLKIDTWKVCPGAHLAKGRVGMGEKRK